MGAIRYSSPRRDRCAVHGRNLGMTRLILGLFAVVCTLAPVSASAADFRIENRVFLDDEPEMVRRVNDAVRHGPRLRFLRRRKRRNRRVRCLASAVHPARSGATRQKPRLSPRTSIPGSKPCRKGRRAREPVRAVSGQAEVRSFLRSSHRRTHHELAVDDLSNRNRTRGGEIAREYGQFADAYARLTAVTSDVPLPPIRGWR